MNVAEVLYGLLPLGAGNGCAMLDEVFGTNAFESVDHALVIELL